MTNHETNGASPDALSDTSPSSCVEGSRSDQKARSLEEEKLPKLAVITVSAAATPDAVAEELNAGIASIAESVGDASADYLAFSTDGRVLAPEAIDAMMRKCQAGGLDVLALTNDRSYAGLFTGSQLYIKMQLFHRSFGHGYESIVVRSGFLREHGIAFDPECQQPQMLFAMECMALAQRAMAYPKSKVFGIGESGAAAPSAGEPQGQTSSLEEVARAAGEIDGCFQTASKFERFCEERGLSIDGKFGKCTMLSLFDKAMSYHSILCEHSIDEILDLSQHLGYAEGFRAGFMGSMVPRKQCDELADSMGRQIAERDRRITDLERWAQELENSSSMRIGKIITAPARKMKDRRAGEAPAAATSAAASTEVATAQPSASGQRSPRVIASLTSFPMRIDNLEPVVRSLAEQTRRPDKVVIWLARPQFPDGELPESLVRLQDLGLEVMWCDDDIRSYKRSVCSFREFPDDILIFFDDDLTYEKGCIAALLEAHERYPLAVVATRVHRIQFADNGMPLPYSEWKMECNDFVGVPRMDLFATNGAGTLYPPHILPDEVLDSQTFMNLAPTADDVWLKMMQTLANVPVVLSREFDILRDVPFSGDYASLWSVNKAFSINDVAMRNLVDRFNLTYGEEDTLLARMRRDA